MLSDTLLDRLERPCRYLGTETNVIKKEWRDTPVRMALAFPDLYEIGMSHVGMSILYSILNELPYALVERVYAPAADFERLLREQAVELASLESNQPLKRFDIVGFSLQYELSYTNVLNMLDLAGIPALAAERGENDPLVIGGGPCSFNPEPVADFFDAILVGDGEFSATHILEAVREWKAAKGSKQELLKRLASIRGVYAPSFFRPRYDSHGLLEVMEPLLPGYEFVEKAIAPDLNDIPIPDKPLVPFMKIVHDRLNLEVARGCVRGCRFCQAGMIYRPVRERTPGELLEKARSVLASTGHNDLSLLSLSTGDYSCLEFLITALMEEWSAQKVSVSLPSLRAGALTSEIMRQIKRVRKTGFTIAPEAGTDRLRRVINKGITEQEILDTAQKAFGLGWNLLKLYFMVGLPTETMEDVEEIAVLAQKALRMSPKKKNVNVSVAQFVPKAHTPFQWSAQESLEQGVEKIDLLKKRLRRPGMNVKWNKPAMSAIEGILARGDRRASGLLMAAHRLGCKFDAWSDSFRYQVWKQAIEETGSRLAEQPLKPWPLDRILPWDHIRSGVKKEFLREEYEKALEGLSTVECRKVCNDCGVCDHKTVRNVLITDEQAPRRIVREEEPATEVRYRYLIRFSKTGPAKYLGHLEMVSVFHRALRRAGLPLRFSEGFHPMPKVSFPEALSVGIESLDEIMQIELARSVSPGDIIKPLNDALPDGLRVSDVSLTERRIAQPVAVRYSVSGAMELLEKDKEDAFRKAPSFVITVERKKGLASIDIKPLVPVFDASGSTLELEIVRKNGVHVKPWDVVRHVFDLTADDKERFSFVKLKADYE